MIENTRCTPGELMTSRSSLPWPLAWRWLSMIARTPAESQNVVPVMSTTSTGGPLAKRGQQAVLDFGAVGHVNFFGHRDDCELPVPVHRQMP